MKKLFAAPPALALMLAAAPALGQVSAWKDVSPEGVRITHETAPDQGLPVAPSRSPWAETTVAMTGGTWALAAAASTTRKRLLLGDTVGLGCVFSYVASPASNEGFPFSTTSQGGSWIFDNPVPTGAVYVKCANSGTLTVASA